MKPENDKGGHRLPQWESNTAPIRHHDLILSLRVFASLDPVLSMTGLARDAPSSLNMNTKALRLCQVSFLASSSQLFP